MGAMDTATGAVKFSADGTMLLEWGQYGSGPGEFIVPHAIALDSEGNVYQTLRSLCRKPNPFGRVTLPIA